MFMLLGGGVGFFGSKALTQMAMGSANTGAMGYLGNAIATAGLSLVAWVFKQRKVSGAILAGGLLQIIARAITDNTPFGGLMTQAGMGDYQMQNFVTPQRLVDPLNSAQIEVPAGWGAPPAVVVAGAAPPGGMHGYSRTGGGLYSGGGLYAS